LRDPDREEFATVGKLNFTSDWVWRWGGHFQRQPEQPSADSWDYEFFLLVVLAALGNTVPNVYKM
jgi:hypothetical protein